MFRIIFLNFVNKKTFLMLRLGLGSSVSPTKVISALFHSSDLKIDFSIACKNTTPFVKLEEKLYEEYPEYKETDNYFLQNGNKIKRFKTMEENNINSGKPIIIFSDNN